ncbi:hypothetical protein BJX64DRAFT_288386 [Aspergillus heterothallicus]
MPTESIIFAATISNLGPLPTDFSLPASCISSTDWVLAFTGQPNARVWSDCSLGPNTCVPSPTDSDALTSIYEINHTPASGHVLGYYSPGVSCPLGWETAARAARDSAGTVSQSGFIAPTTTATTTTDDGGGGDSVPTFRHALVSLLDPGETAVWCCPSYVNDSRPRGRMVLLRAVRLHPVYRLRLTGPGAGGRETTGIQGDDGQTTEGIVEVISATSTGTVLTTTFSASAVTDFLAYSQVPIVRFVQRPGDLSSSPGGGEDEQRETTSSGVTPSQTSDSENIGLWQRQYWGSSIGALAISVGVGAALFLVC